MLWRHLKMSWQLRKVIYWQRKNFHKMKTSWETLFFFVFQQKNAALIKTILHPSSTFCNQTSTTRSWFVGGWRPTYLAGSENVPELRNVWGGVLCSCRREREVGGRGDGWRRLFCGLFRNEWHHQTASETPPLTLPRTGKYDVKISGGNGRR